MSSKKDDREYPPADPISNPTVIASTPMDAVWAREREKIRRKLAEDDAKRAAMPKIKMVAITGFTIISDDFPDGRVIECGEEFEISEFDLPTYSARAFPASMYVRRE